MTDNIWPIAGTVIAVLAFGATIAGAFVGYGRLKSKAEQAEEKANLALKRIDRLGSEQAAFREMAAREFVSMSMLEKVEERVIGAIDRLADRLDRAFESKKRE